MSPKQPTLDAILDLINSGEFDKALEALDSFDHEELVVEDRARIFATYVYCLRCLGEEEAAEQTLAEIEAFVAEEPELALAVGEELLELEEDEDAEWIFERYCLAHPKDDAGWYNLAFTRESLGEFEEALSAYTTALDLDPEFADAYRGKGSCLDALGRLPEAIDYYQRYLALNPTDADTWIGLGNARTDQKDFDGAYAAYSSAEQLEAEPPRLYLMWAISALGRQDSGRLDLCLERMKESSPGDWRTIAVDAMVAELHGDCARGWERYREAFELTAENFPLSATYVAAELMLSYAVRNELNAEYAEVVPLLFEARAFSETVLGAMRILSGQYSENAADYAVVVEGSLAEDDVDDIPDEANDYGPPYRFLRLVRVLATSEDEAVRMVMDFETRCKATRLIIHEVKQTKWEGGGHLGVWLRPPAEVFSENTPDGVHDN